MPQYRYEFFSLLKQRLEKEQIDLQIVYGSMDSKGKNDSSELSFGHYRENKMIRLGKHHLIWQPCLKELQKADLVIVEQANKLLINYVLILRRFLGGKKFAFWGHGLNMQTKEKTFFNRFKKLYSNYTDHWFAYTPKVKNRLIDNGYEDKKITVVDNAIDTKKLREQYRSITLAEQTALKQQLHIPDNMPVFIYCGALYKEKRLDFLVASGDRMAAMGLSFKLIVVGGGPDATYMQEASKTRPWMAMTGPKFGRDKALYFSIADLFLMPGAIGLAILDAFAFQTPMITTDYAFHGPEFEYLIDGHNGFVTQDNLDSYVNQVVALLNDKRLLEQLKQSCLESAAIYTVENMVNNFTQGVHEALS